MIKIFATYLGFHLYLYQANQTKGRSLKVASNL